MRIENTTLQQNSPTRRKSVTGATTTGFADILNAAEAEEASPAAPTGNVAAAGLFLLQEVDEEETKRRKIIEHGHDMLDSLGRLRDALLSGIIPSDMLDELAERLNRQREQFAEPHLLAIIEDIELRVAVEQAKLEMAASTKEGIKLLPNETA